MFSEMLAGLPQRTKTTFWCSRDFRNEKKVLFGVCGISATRENCFLGFAGFPQQGKTAFWRLRDSRNEGKLLFGACGSPASISKNVLTIADFRRHTADFILTSNSRFCKVVRTSSGDSSSSASSFRLHPLTRAKSRERMAVGDTSGSGSSESDNSSRVTSSSSISSTSLALPIPFVTYASTNVAPSPSAVWCDGTAETSGIGGKTNGRLAMNVMEIFSSEPAPPFGRDMDAAWDRLLRLSDMAIMHAKSGTVRHL